MTHLERALVRRIDRLARRAHRHYRFAHHPLCSAYASERIRVGRFHLCRGCASALGGALLGLVAGALLAASAAVLAVVAGVGAGLGLLGTAHHLPFLGKVTTRALPAAAAAYVFVTGLRRTNVLGLGAAGLTLLLVGVGIRLYRRRGPGRAPCEGCPERAHAPCSGYRHLHRRERAFQRLTGRWLDEAPVRREADSGSRAEPVHARVHPVAIPGTTGGGAPPTRTTGVRRAATEVQSA